MLILMGHLHVDPPAVHELVADLQAITPNIRVEEGNLFYSSALDEAVVGRVLLVQCWQDKDALIAHFEQRHTQAFNEKWSGKIKTDLRTYDAPNPRSAPG